MASPISSTFRSKAAPTSFPKSSTPVISPLERKSPHLRDALADPREEVMNEPIKDKAPKPPGLLPKNVQSWVIVGIAVLMILIMWLTGGKKPQSATKAALPNVLATPPVEVN